jgi:hypothetical protein
LTEKTEDENRNKRDGRKRDTIIDRPDTVHVNDRPDMLHVDGRPDVTHVGDRPDVTHVADRPDVTHVADRPEVLESEKRSDSKKRRKTQGDPDDLQAERGGLKVKDSDFNTK